MSKRRVAYIRARLLDPASQLDAPGALLTEGETILDFGPSLFNDGLPPDAVRIDCGGQVLAPGLIDMRAHCGEPGREYQETMATASQAAAAGGVTTIVSTPDTKPVVDEVALVDFLARRARDTAIINVVPMAAITRGMEGHEITEMGLLAAAGAVAFNDGDRSIADAQVMRRALSYARTFDLLLCPHVQEGSLSAGGDMNEGELATRLGLAGIPPCAEAIAVERDLRLVELTGARWHAAGLSTAAAADALRRAKRQGLPVSAGIAPQYFALNEQAVFEYRTFAKLTPPLRSEDDRKAMVAALADGTIDVICSHHSPRNQDSKRLPFPAAASGGVGLETLLAIALQLYHDKALTLLQVIGKMTEAPARLLKLPGGKLAKGAPADLVLFDPDRAWRIDADKLRGKSKNSPFDRQPTQGRVLRSVVAGRSVFELGHPEPATQQQERLRHA